MGKTLLNLIFYLSTVSFLFAFNGFDIVRDNLNNDNFILQKKDLDTIILNPESFSLKERTFATKLKALLETTNKDDIVKASTDSSDPKLQEWAQEILSDEEDILESGEKFSDSAYIDALEKSLREKQTAIEKCTTPEEIDEVDSIGSEYLEKLKMQRKSKLIKIRAALLALSDLKKYHDIDQDFSQNQPENTIINLDGAFDFIETILNLRPYHSIHYFYEDSFSHYEPSNITFYSNTTRIISKSSIFRDGILDLIEIMLNKAPKSLNQKEQEYLKSLLDKKTLWQIEKFSGKICQYLGVNYLVNRLESIHKTRSYTPFEEALTHLEESLSHLLASENITDKNAKKLFLSIKNKYFKQKYLKTLGQAYFAHPLSLNRTKHFIAELTKEDNRLGYSASLVRTYLNLVKSFNNNKADYELLSAIATKPLLALKVLEPWLKDNDDIPPLTKHRLVNIVLESLDFAKIIQEESFKEPLQKLLTTLAEKARQTGDFDEIIIKLLDDRVSVNRLITNQELSERMMIKYVQEIQELENKTFTKDTNTKIAVKLKTLSQLLRISHNLRVLVASSFYPKPQSPLHLSKSIKEVIENLYNKLPSKVDKKFVIPPLRTFGDKEDFIKTLYEAKINLGYTLVKTVEEKTNLEQALKDFQAFIDGITKTNTWLTQTKKKRRTSNDISVKSFSGFYR